MEKNAWVTKALEDVEQFCLNNDLPEMAMAVDNALACYFRATELGNSERPCNSSQEAAVLRLVSSR